MAQNKLAALALSQLFGVVIEHGKPIVTAEVLKGIRQAIDDRKDNAAANDVRDGWSATNVGDPKNDYDGDALAKRADNMLFLFGKALPGKATDFIRDTLSPDITPEVRAQIDESTTAEQLAALVGDALYARAAAAIESAAG